MNKFTTYVGRYFGFWPCILWLTAFFLMVVTISGCSQPRTPEQTYMTLENMKQAKKYAEELAFCTATSATIAQSRICRCDVNQRWGRACVDEITVVP